MADFFAYLEQHPGLFVALGGVATVIGRLRRLCNSVLCHASKSGQGPARIEPGQEKGKLGISEDQTRQLNKDKEGECREKLQAIAALESEKVKVVQSNKRSSDFATSWMPANAPSQGSETS